jgi:hypothetical protein
MLEKWAVLESKDWLGEAVTVRIVRFFFSFSYNFSFSSKELEPLKQACGFLCLSSKNVIATEQVRNQLCAKLSCRQLKQVESILLLFSFS